MSIIWKSLKELFWLAVAVAIVGGGWFGFQTLGANRTEVVASPVAVNTPSVETAPLALHDGGIPIRGEGFVRASRSLALAAQASGRIVELHPAIDARGTFEQGEVLFRLDDRNARASVAQIVATIESSRAQLDLVATQLERSRSLRERGVISQDQLDQVETRRVELEANLRSLQANLEAAEVALADTVVTAPFDGRVLSKDAELGAVLAQGAPVAQIYSVDALEVNIAIRESEAALIPDLFAQPQSLAVIEGNFAGQTYVWQARIARVDRQIDAQTRTILVTLALDDPQQGRSLDGSSKTLPALINAFVSARIEPAASGSVYVAEASAIKDSAFIWLAENGVLRSEPVDVLHRDGGQVFFTAANVQPGDQLITSALSAASDGMAITVNQPSSAQQTGS